MKKFLSLMLAVLMLILPVFSMAEDAGADVTAELGGLLTAAQRNSYVMKYMAEGQRLVTDVSLEPGAALAVLAGEDFRQPVQDLLAALKIQAVGQKADGQAQGTLRILMNDESAADATMAAGQDGVFVASSFLGDKIVRVTMEQMAQLGDRMAQQLVDGGRITQEQLDAMKAAFEAFRQDPMGSVLALIGEVNLESLMSALMGIMAEVTTEEVAEVPEDVAIDAKYLMTIPLKKDSLTNVTTELAKLLWSMPGVQKAAGAMQVKDKPVTEERLIAWLNAIPGALAEDTAIRVYLTEDQKTVQVISDVKLAVQGQEIQEKMDAVVESLDNGAVMTCSVEVQSGDQGMIMASTWAVEIGENAGGLTYAVTALAFDGENEFAPVQQVGTATWTEQDAERTMTMDVDSRMQTSPGAEATGLVYRIESVEKDLGDHAEETATVKLSIEDLGEIITIRVNAATDLAEAYIITEDAVQPLAMSEEERSAFQQEVMTSAQLGAVTLLSKLPTSVQTLVMNLMSLFGGFMQ